MVVLTATAIILFVAGALSVHGVHALYRVTETSAGDESGLRAGRFDKRFDRAPSARVATSARLGGANVKDARNNNNTNASPDARVGVKSRRARGRQNGSEVASLAGNPCTPLMEYNVAPPHERTMMPPVSLLKSIKPQFVAMLKYTFCSNAIPQIRRCVRMRCARLMTCGVLYRESRGQGRRSVLPTYGGNGVLSHKLS